MTRPWQPAVTLTGVHQVFSPCFFHASISIETLVSDSLSLSTSSTTEWTLVYLLLCSTSAEGL